MPKSILTALAVAAALAASVPALAAESEKGKSEPPKTESPKGADDTAKSDRAKAAADRKKPLQRCDQMSDKAQLECLNQAREKIVEARKKRQDKGEKK